MFQSCWSHTPLAHAQWETETNMSSIPQLGTSSFPMDFSHFAERLGFSGPALKLQYFGKKPFEESLCNFRCGLQIWSTLQSREFASDLVPKFDSTSKTR